MIGLKHMQFVSFAKAFENELVRQYGSETDVDGDSVREYARRAASRYFDNPRFWRHDRRSGEKIIDPRVCAAFDLAHEWEFTK